MASVKSVTTHDDYPSGDLRERRYSVTITNNSLIDEEYIRSPVVVDAADDGTASGAQQLSQLTDNEYNSRRVVGIAAVEYQTDPDYYRRVLGRAMLISDVDEVLSYIPIWTDMENHPDSGNNKNARSIWLGVPLVDYTLMETRFGSLQGIAGGVASDKPRIWDELPAEFE